VLENESRVRSQISKDNQRIKNQIRELKKKKSAIEKNIKTLFLKLMERQRKQYLLKRTKSIRVPGVKQKNKKGGLSDYYSTQ
jgi:hypothetical protein